MADSVKEKLFQELAKMLRTITVVNGYENDVLKVYEEVIPLGQISEFPALVIDQGRDTTRPARTTGMLEFEVTVFLDCFMPESDAPQRLLRKMEQDLQRLFYRDLYTAGRGYSINGTAFEVKWVGSEPFGTRAEAPNNAMTVELLVSYHQNIIDATKKA
jgi:hypothetical protein